MAKQVTRTEVKRRETYSVRLPQDLMIRLKHLAIDERKTISQLTEEAIGELLSRYKR